MILVSHTISLFFFVLPKMYPVCSGSPIGERQNETKRRRKKEKLKVFWCIH